MQYVLDQRKVVMFPETSRLKKILSLTRPHSPMCIKIYIFNFKKTKPKIARRQKAKETKEEKRMSVENLTRHDNIVCEFALCTF